MRSDAVHIWHHGQAEVRHGFTMHKCRTRVRTKMIGAALRQEPRFNRGTSSTQRPTFAFIGFYADGGRQRVPRLQIRSAAGVGTLDTRRLTKEIMVPRR